PRTPTSTLFPYTTLFRSHRFAAEQDLPGIGRLHPGQAAHERGLAGAVIADERGNLTLGDRQGHLGERADRVERFGEVAGLEQGRSEEHTSELQSLAYLVC